MPTVNIVKKLIKSDHYNSKWVLNRYDLNLSSFEKKWNFSFEFPSEWKIGLIVGNSGSGKSLVSREIFPKVYQGQIIKNDQIPLIESFEKYSVENIVNALISVGLGSAPEWLTPYSLLSTGQKMRADLAECILNNENLIVYDEFTSVVNRKIAKIISYCISKAFKKSSKQFVAITCHHDVEEWLEPNWVLDMDLKEFRLSKKKRPKLAIKVQRAHKYSWEFFKNYHYLNYEMSHSASCWVAYYENDPCAFISTILFPHPKAKNIYKTHRLVVLPEYQGLGIGRILTDEIAKHYVSNGKRYRETTSHPARILSHKKNPNWKCVHYGRMVASKEKSGGRIGYSNNRLTSTWEYFL